MAGPPSLFSKEGWRAVVVDRLTVEEWEARVGDALVPAPGFRVRVLDAWDGVVTAVLQRTVVVRDPRISEEDLCRILVLKGDALVLDESEIRWGTARSGRVISYSPTSKRHRAVWVTTEEALSLQSDAS